MDKLLEEITRATKLTREGRLGAATTAIRRALGSLRPRAHAQPAHPAQPVHPALDDVIDVVARETPGPAPREAPHVPPARDRRAPAFESHYFHFGDQRYRYRLYLPALQADAGPRPVIVMLHGCKQDAADFARGTRMNEVADAHGCIVVYPEQIAVANSMRCWNWFEPAHQQRGRGEPGMVAALAREIVAQHGGDAGRVYVAGLSAGGALAALLGQLHPEVFAGVGVHSGLAPAMANDLVSAFSAMRRGDRKGTADAAKTRATVPAIVFHGTADRTVHPANGDRIVEESLESWAAHGLPLQPSVETIPGTRQAIRTVYAAPDGTTPLEVWEIDAGPHAWSGGSSDGSFTDPDAPDASKAMLAFFLRQPPRR